MRTSEKNLPYSLSYSRDAGRCKAAPDKPHIFHLHRRRKLIDIDPSIPYHRTVQSLAARYRLFGRTTMDERPRGIACCGARQDERRTPMAAGKTMEVTDESFEADVLQ
jgi:hypothetical protein